MYHLKDREWIFVYTGPDGSGRKTVANLVGATFGMKKVVSYSTRERRPGEVDGLDYHFITTDEFLLAEKQHEFLESLQIRSNYYGIKHADIERLFERSKCIYVVMNKEGANTMKQLYGDKVIRIFIHANSQTVAARQLEKGLSESTVQLNLQKYEEDMAYKEQCELAFENYELAHTTFEVTGALEPYLQRELLELD
jgi:guanylate kinase